MAWRILSADGKSGENYNLPAHMNEVGMTAGAELTGKVALVTGGARNIGRAISRSLAAGGATVMVNANTSQGDAKSTVAMIKSNGGAAAFHFADVTDPGAVAKMVDATVKQFGRLDILVNNAAVRSETPFEDIKLEEWRHVISTVLDGAFLCTQSCLPHLIRVRGGAIVNIGGLTAHKGATGRAHVIAAMASKLNHTIVHSKDPRAAAEFFSGLFGLPAPKAFGPFLDVQVGNEVTLAFLSADGMEIQMQHYAFLVSEQEFDQIFGRIKARKLKYWADPEQKQAGKINNYFGGRGVYFEDLSGHLLEIIT